MNQKQVQQVLEEQVERIGSLEHRLGTLTQLLDGYKAREQAVVDSLNQASETAKVRVSQAEQTARQLLAGAEAQAEQTAKKVVADARAEADALLVAARNESARVLSEAEQAVRGYRERLAAYNDNLKRGAAEVEAIATRYAAFIQNRVLEDEFSRPAAESSPSGNTAGKEPLAPANNPQQLMHNIYKLQNRDIFGLSEPGPDGVPRMRPAAGLPDLFEEIIADLGPRPAVIPAFASQSAPAPQPQPKTKPAPQPASALPTNLFDEIIADLGPRPSAIGDPSSQFSPVPTPQPELTYEWQPASQPEWRPEPKPEPKPMPASAPEPAPHPEWRSEPMPASTPEPAFQPEWRPDPVLTPVPKPASASAPKSAPQPEWQPEPVYEWSPDYEPESAPQVSSFVSDDTEEEMSLDNLLDEIIAAGDI